MSMILRVNQKSQNTYTHTKSNININVNQKLKSKHFLHAKYVHLKSNEPDMFWCLRQRPEVSQLTPTSPRWSPQY